MGEPKLFLHAACQDWKGGSHCLGNVQPYAPGGDGPALNNVAVPEMLICNVEETASGKKTLNLPPSIRSKWMDDALRKTEWQQEIQIFDARLARNITQVFSSFVSGYLGTDSVTLY